MKFSHLLSAILFGILWGLCGEFVGRFWRVFSMLVCIGAFYACIYSIIWRTKSFRKEGLQKHSVSV